MNLHSFANQVVDHCLSTNDLARAMGEAGFPHGTWVSARAQAAGRGRMGKTWQSQEGNLFLSLVIRPPSRAVCSWLPLTAAVGTTFFLRKRFPSLEIKIKWPNDLFLSNSKLGGFLCEGLSTSEKSFVVVGLGLNCALSPQGLDQPTISLQKALKKKGGANSEKITADSLRPQIIEALLKSYSCLFSSKGSSSFGPGQVAKRYAQFAYFTPGMPVQWSSGERGVVKGLGQYGELLVIKEGGGCLPLFAEEVQTRRGVARVCRI